MALGRVKGYNGKMKSTLMRLLVGILVCLGVVLVVDRNVYTKALAQGTKPSSTPLATIVPQVNIAPVTLESYLRTASRPPLTPWTFLSYFIRNAVDKGISANMIVFLLLFPVIASIVAFSRHVIGLTGFSIYAPAALAVVLLNTGIISGILLFVGLLLIAIIGKQFIRLFKLEYVPRTAMLLWFVSIGAFLAIFVSTLFPTSFFLHIEMFPLLILVLLSEDFMGTQADLPWHVAVERSLQMMTLAVIGAFVMGERAVQEFVLIRPEIVVVGVAVLNFFVGRYLGLRLTEYFRFKSIIDAEE